MAEVPSADISIQLHSKTSPDWFSKILLDFDSFLVDHAASERKASATGISFVVQYPNRVELIEPMIRLAREELQHFHQVSRVMLDRGLRFRGDEKSPYVNALLGQLRHGGEERFLDRLLIFGIAEARGQERFALIGREHPDNELSSFYRALALAEERHHQMYIDLACFYFESGVVRERLDQLLEIEAEALKKLPFRVAVH